MSAGRKAPAVAITGIGAISAYGLDADSFYEGLVSERPVIEAVVLPGIEKGGRIWFSGVRNFNALDWVDERIIDGTDILAQWAIATASQALAQSGIELDPLRTAIVQGASICGAQSLMRAQYEVDINGPAAFPRKTMMRVLTNMGAAQIAMLHGIHGPSLTVTTACAAALDALGMAARMIASGEVDAAIVGGTEAGCSLSLTGTPPDFLPSMAYAPAMFGMQSDESDVKKACRPFDVHRSGIATSEGAAAFVLERGDLAVARGARIFGYVAGYGTVADAYHPSAPDPSGEWEARAMEIAIRNSGLQAADIDCLYAHATGTPVGDIAEIRAINRVHGKRQNPLRATSVKGHFGHTAAASGGMSVIAGLCDMAAGQCVNTANTTDPDPEARFEVIIEAPREMTANAFQVNAFGFGGQNASLVITREAVN